MLINNPFSAIIFISGGNCTGEIMQEKVQVLGIELDNCSTKEGMKRVVDYMQMERMNVVEMITMNTVAHFQAIEDEKNVFQTFDLVLPSDRGILQAVGIEDERRLKEVDEFLFIKMVIRYLQKNGIRVFLLSQSEISRLQMEKYIEEEFENLNIVASTSLEERMSSDDIFNLINGSEVECVLSTLMSPVEEYFISRNRSMINARIWLGFGALLNDMKKEKKGWEKIVQRIYRRILKKEVEKNKKEI